MKAETKRNATVRTTTLDECCDDLQFARWQHAAENKFVDYAGHLINAVTGKATSISNDTEEVRELETLGGRSITRDSTVLGVGRREVWTPRMEPSPSTASWSAIAEVVGGWRNVH